MTRWKQRAGFTLCPSASGGHRWSVPCRRRRLAAGRICLFGGRYDVVVIAAPCRIKAGGIAYRDGKRRSFGHAVDTGQQALPATESTRMTERRLNRCRSLTRPRHRRRGERSRRVGKRNAQHVGCPCTVLIIIPKRLCQAADACKRMVALRQAEQAGCRFLRRGKLVRFHSCPPHRISTGLPGLVMSFSLDAFKPFHADGKSVPVISCISLSQAVPMAATA